MTDDWRADDHPGDAELASFIDGTLAIGERRVFERHLTACAECRADLAAAGRVLAGSQPRRRWPVLLPAAAAAALLLVWVAPSVTRKAEVHRAPTLTEVSAPVLVGPIGAVEMPVVMRWHPVSYADEYRVTLYSSDGGALWEARTAETELALPDSIALLGGTSYFWQLEARVGRDRWVASDLTEFIPQER